MSRRGADDEVVALARRIAALGEGERSRVFELSWWTERMLDYAMAHPSFKTQLFRFVDVFPATTGDADVLRHVVEYFDEAEAPRALDLGVELAERIPLGDRLSASVARRNIRRMAEQFIVGASPEAALPGLERLWRAGTATTVDLLGEKTVSEPEADRYAARVDELLGTLLRASATWAPDDLLDRDDLGPLPRANVSIKPTALASSYAPLTAEDGLEQAKGRLRPLLRRAAAEGAFVWFDMEHYDVKDLTLRLFTELLDEPDHAGVDAGIVVQAYLKDSYRDLQSLTAWAEGRARPIGIRLVKGAYWDAETITARAEGWPVPVFAHKAETDANYERCAELLHRFHGRVRAAFGSHNLRSIAAAVTAARRLGIPDDGYEVQMLYGMAEPMQAAIRRLGLRLRVYAPVGELVPGMAYLVRRLLENTSNESFVRHRFAEGADLDELLAPPAIDALPEPEPPARRAPTDPADPGPYEPEPPAEFRRAQVQEAFGAAVATVGGRHEPVEVEGLVDGRPVRTVRRLERRDPGNTSRLVSVSACCGVAEADAAIEAAQRAEHGWRDTPAAERAAVLFRAAEWLRARRDRIAALEVFEAGKPWREADADVCEAIDFCEYYGRQAIRLSRGGEVASPPGERNRLSYEPKGIGVVIAPWNFPLAIPCGMVTAALVTGNCVLFKPAEQTPGVASQLVDALTAAGLPPGVLAFLPGIGEEIGAHLVGRPEVAFVTFTGSKAVGLAILEEAGRHRPGQRQLKRVVAELGGKNALIVDADADLDQAVPAVAASAFGYAGQKCSAASRLILLDVVHDEAVARLLAHVENLRVGHPSDRGAQVPPVIDGEAYERILGQVERAREEAEVAVSGATVPDGGWFVPPVVVTGVAPDAAVATEEVFGPVLCVFRVPDLDAAIELANATDYALTAGIFSRSPAHIAAATRRLRAGNVYVNRGITGAVVGRQPFGGYGMSGVGSKAGGPDYLLQFVDPKVVTENTMRQGFAPE